MDDLTAERVKAGLETALFGRNVSYRAETGSSNDEMHRLARAGAEEGSLVICDHQTCGRGRLGRRWEAPPCSSLLMSLLFRPALAPHEVHRLTMICGLAVLDAVENQSGLRASLKWPNDIMVAGAKVGGMLTELELRGREVDYVIVGLGINVNLDPAQLPDNLLAVATSLSHALGKPVARLPLLWDLLRSLEARYQALKEGQDPLDEWAEALETLHRPVTVSTGSQVVQGLAVGADASGALLVRLPDGRLKTVHAGDVAVRVHDGQMGWSATEMAVLSRTR